MREGGEPEGKRGGQHITPVSTGHGVGDSARTRHVPSRTVQVSTRHGVSQYRTWHSEGVGCYRTPFTSTPTTTICLLDVSTGHHVHPEIKYKKPHSWYKLYGKCGFLYWISGCSTGGGWYLIRRTRPQTTEADHQHAPSLPLPLPPSLSNPDTPLAPSSSLCSLLAVSVTKVLLFDKFVTDVEPRYGSWQSCLCPLQKYAGRSWSYRSLASVQKGCGDIRLAL
eukprot:3176493-Rhodomonas_salina.1